MPPAADAPLRTVGEIQRWTWQYFNDKGIPNPRLDADLLIAHALGVSRIQVYTQFDRPLGPEERDRVRDLVRRRAGREPVAYLLGEREFYGLRFTVSSAVLIPRPETEHLVEAAIETLKEKPGASLLDMGTGTGCIPIAVLANLEGARALAVDRSAEALAVARANAERLGVADRMEWLESDWFSAVPAGRFDCITANPPYIPHAEIASLMPDVARWEPHGALDGGQDGLDSIRAILGGAPDRLAQKGFLLMEVGAGQAQTVNQMAAANPAWNPLVALKDHAGIERVVRLERR